MTQAKIDKTADRQLELYLALRSRLLSRDFHTEEGIGTRAFASEVGLSHKAAIGLLNGLSSDGYLERRWRSYFPIDWNRERLTDCFGRLAVLVGICARRIADDEARLKRLREIIRTARGLRLDDENLFLKFLEALSVLFNSGHRSSLAEVANRIIPPAFFRICWTVFAGRAICAEFLGLVSNWSSMETEASAAEAKMLIVEVWRDLRAEVFAASESGDDLFGLARVERLNQLREMDFRERAVSMSLPAFPILIPFLTASSEPWVFEDSSIECLNADR